MKRSNPGRSSPRGAAAPIDFETGAVPAPSRSTSDFAGSSVRRHRRLAEARGTAAHLDGRKRRRGARRVEGENGSFPASAEAPRRPPVLVFYDDLVEVGPAPEPIYGQFPAAFIGKILPWLRCARREVLHVCSGALPRGEGIRVDIREEACPDILADGRALPLPDGSQTAVLIDPPYTPHYARKLYGVEYPRPSELLREAARVVRPGGRIGFVHYITPKPPPGTRFVKAFGLSTGFDMPIRAVCIYERHQPELALGEA